VFYKLSRFSKFHTKLRKVAYSILWRLPYSIKYRMFRLYLKNVKPYSVIRPGDTIIQVGAPWDILRSGRSRAVQFALQVGDSGRVFVFEPVEQSNLEMSSALGKLGINCMTQYQTGLWSHKCKLRFFSDPNHPASNLVSEVYDANRTDMEKYDSMDVDVTSMSVALKSEHIDQIRLLSLTTNGAEEKIIEGIGSKLLSRIEFLSVIDDPRKTSVYSKAGFEYFSEDDRGYLLKRVGSV